MAQAVEQKDDKQLSEMDRLIKKLELEPLVGEGGYFKETYRSSDKVSLNGKERTASTCIYYLITKESFSSLHRLNCDEGWHFYCGDPIEMVIIEDKKAQFVTLGTDIMGGQVPQLMVTKNRWFGGKLKENDVGNGCGWALIGATVAPGFEFEDFES